MLTGIKYVICVFIKYFLYYNMYLDIFIVKILKKNRKQCLSFFNLYLFLRQREREHEWGRVRERGRHRIRSRLQGPSCQHRARRRAWTHGPWDHDLSRSQPLNWLSHPGALALPIFELGFVVVVSFRSSLYILDINHLSDI